MVQYTELQYAKIAFFFEIAVFFSKKYQLGNVFDMLGVREHVDRLDAGHPVFGNQKGEVAGLCGGVAADIYNFSWLHGEQLLDHFFVHAGAWRVGDDHVGLAVGDHEVGGEDLGHVARMELDIGDMVLQGILTGRHHGVFDIFDAYDTAAEVGQEECDGASAGVEVIDHVVGGHLGKLGHEAVKPLGLARVSLVEGLGAYGEMEVGGAIVVLHDFGKVVAAGECHGGEVGIGVVHLIVEDVLQRGDLGELVAQVLHEAFPSGVVFRNDKHHHPLASAGVADDEVAEAASVVAYIVVRKGMCLGIVAHREAYLVAQVLLEGAMFDVQHLVKKGRDVESQCTVGLDFPFGVNGCVLGWGQFVPCAGGKSEFQLVTIVEYIFRATDGEHALTVDVTEPFKVVADLLLLGSELLVVLEVLPTAAATGAEMGALGGGTLVAVVFDIHRAALGIFLFLLENLDIYDIARHYKGEEDDHAINMCDGLALGTDIGDKHVLYYRLFLFSTHCVIDTMVILLRRKH